MQHPVAELGGRHEGWDCRDVAPESEGSPAQTQDSQLKLVKLMRHMGDASG
jgi:hypothetical protein